MNSLFKYSTVAEDNNQIETKTRERRARDGVFSSLWHMMPVRAGEKRLALDLKEVQKWA